MKRCIMLLLAAVISLGGAEVMKAAGENVSPQGVISASGIKGGLIVHVNCGDGKMTAALRVNDRYVVEGLDTDTTSIRKAREHIQSLGIYGKVTVQKFDGKTLPYIDNMVNLVVAEDPGDIPMDEIMRVLTPNGVAMLKGEKIVKPWPSDMDEWTHYMHDASGNCVSEDTIVGPPRRVQWVGSPKWARSHEHTASLQALVSARGRIFYVMDEGSRASIQLPSKYTLVARDAFNGTTLWKREIPDWFNHLYPLKSGPGYMPRRLVAVDETVYVSPGTGHNLLALDAATGELLREYEDTSTTVDIILSDNVLFIVVDPDREKVDYNQQDANCWRERDRASVRWGWQREPDNVMAIEAVTGKVLWEKEVCVTPMTLAVDKARACLFDGQSLVCLDRSNGEENWKSEAMEDIALPIRTGYAPKLIIHDGYVLLSPLNKIYAFNANTGDLVWQVQEKPRSGHFTPEDLFIIDGLVWAAGTARGVESTFVAYDLKTGEKKKEYPCEINTFFMHQRCYPGRATTNYLIPAATGTEFVDLNTGEWEIHHWVRGGCIYGMMPCNGLLYATPHACACYYQSKLNGFNALTPVDSNSERRAQRLNTSERLEKGKAYGEIDAAKEAESSSWSTYRHDTKRSGSTDAAVPENLKQAWAAAIGEKLTAITVAYGKLFVCDVDRHIVHCLDASSGQKVWSFNAGGRVDSPPTIYKGMAIFGCADGYIYALRAMDGELAWRFRTAPTDERLMSYGQLESVWPLPGTVLIQNDTIYAVAGRSMFLDGGIRMVLLRPETGELVSESIMDDKIPGTTDNLQNLISGKHMPVSLPDLLSSDGKFVYMKSQTFDMNGERIRTEPQKPVTQGGEETHLFSPISFLDDSWFHRSYWLYGRSAGEGWREWQIPPRHVPSGRIMVVDDNAAYGYGRDPDLYTNSSVLEYRLYAADKEYSAERTKRLVDAKEDTVNWHNRRELPEEELTSVAYKWKVEHPPLAVRAMVAAGDLLLAAGPPDIVDEKEMWGRSNEEEFQRLMAEQAALLEGKEGATLWAVSKKDGKRRSEQKLDCIPVWDGMAVTDGKLFMSMMDGTVRCFTGR